MIHTYNQSNNMAGLLFQLDDKQSPYPCGLEVAASVGQELSREQELRNRTSISIVVVFGMQGNTFTVYKINKICLE